MNDAGTGHILTVAQAWLDQDPDPETRDELGTLVRDAQGGSEPALDELHSRFDTRLEGGVDAVGQRPQTGRVQVREVDEGRALER